MVPAIRFTKGFRHWNLPLGSSRLLVPGAAENQTGSSSRQHGFPKNCCFGARLSSLQPLPRRPGWPKHCIPRAWCIILLWRRDADPLGLLEKRRKERSCWCFPPLYLIANCHTSTTVRSAPLLPEELCPRSLHPTARPRGFRHTGPGAHTMPGREEEPRICPL